MKHQAGFTLIELLVAMGIAVLLAVLAYEAVDQVVTLRQQGMERQAQLRQLERLMWKLEQDVLQMAPRPVRGPYGGQQPAMVLDEQGWRWSRIALGPQPTGGGGVVRIGWQLVGDRLVRQVWPVLDQAPDTRPREQVMLRHVRRFEVALWPSQSAQPVSIWPPQPVAEHLRQLPQLMRVRIELDSGLALERWWMGV